MQSGAAESHVDIVEWLLSCCPQLSPSPEAMGAIPGQVSMSLEPRVSGPAHIGPSLIAPSPGLSLLYIAPVLMA